MMFQGDVPRLLQHILLVITFKWNVHKLVYLKLVMQNAKSYETDVTIQIICDESAALNRTLELWDMTAWVHQSQTELDLDVNHQTQQKAYGMLWDHRQIIEQAAAKGLYTTYLIIEDDTGITWPALMSWALDQQVLQPLGFSRAFYRTEIRPEDGMSVLLDVWNTIDLDAYNRTVTLPHTHHLGLSSQIADGTSMRILRPHSHYIQLEPSYMGMWLASHATLLKWMEHAFWDQDSALAANIGYDFGYPERSNGMFMFIDVPEGFHTNYVVPYDPIERVLEYDARVYHERNGYSTQPGTQHGKLYEHALFAPTGTLQ